MIQKKSLFSWVFQRYRGLQLLLLGVIVVTVFFRVVPLEMQKRIVNQAIRLKKIDLLLMYCAFYLGAVVLAGSLKYFINVLQGYIGQKILYEIRTELYRHVLQLPLPFFRRTPPGMVISSLTSELSAVGDFLGSALAVPVINVLTLFAFAGYLMYLNPLLGLLSLAIYPVEIAIIPMLQGRYNRLNQERIDVNRSLSNTIGEAVSGIQDVHGHAGYPVETQKFEGFVGKIFALRQKMNILNYGIKFTNNFFQNLGPFTLFLLGGYLTMTGRFNLGALVAFLSAYEKLYDPWKELMDYYQDLQDSRVRYRKVMDYFDVEPEFALVSAERKPHDLRGKVEVKDLSYLAEGQVQLLDRISLSLQPGEHLALVGFSGSGKSTLALIMGQLYHYNQGHVLLDDKELKTLSKMDVSRNVGFVAQQPFVFDGTIRENLLYACQSLFLAADPKEGIALPEREQILATVQQVGLTDDILRLGMKSVLPRERWQANVPRLIKTRRRFHQQRGTPLVDLVEVFDVTRFLKQRSIYGNIVFGDPQGDEFKQETVATNPSFRKLLRDTGLDQPLLELGKNLATQTVMLFRDVRQDPGLSEISPVPLEQLEPYGDLVGRSFRSHSTAEAKRDEELLLELALRFVPGQHKLATMPAALENSILEARHRFIEQIGRQDWLECQFSLEGIPAQDVGEVAESETGVTFYCPSQYLFTKSILDNILFGRVRADQAKAAEQVQQWLVELLKEENLLDEVLDIGFDFQVGSKGDRLSGGQKQKVALARALLKKPRILILDEATASLDNTSQARIQRLLETELKGVCTVVAVMHRLDMAGSYDQIAVLKAGKLVELGRYAQLMEAKGIFYDLRQGTFQPV